jgi:hypothetical protein
LVASILWTILMAILNSFGISFFILSGIIAILLISLIYFIK